jgi:hypothetical protein
MDVRAVRQVELGVGGESHLFIANIANIVTVELLGAGSKVSDSGFADASHSRRLAAIANGREWRCGALPRLWNPRAF